MIAAAAIIAGLISLSLVGAFVWAIVRGDTRADQLTVERAKHSATQLDLDRERFKTEALRQQLAIETKRANAFEEALADVQANPNSDLDRADVRSRVRRAAEAARTAADRTGAAPAVAVEPVRAPTAADGSGAPVVLGGLDPQERLL